MDMGALASETSIGSSLPNYAAIGLPWFSGKGKESQLVKMIG
jgi:hypothetical protein